MRPKLSLLAGLALLSGCGDNEAERAVRATMRDPAATQFRSVERCSADRDVWTGQVNGKNGFGAYTGFGTFFYANSTVYTTDGNGDGFLAAMDRCYGIKRDADLAATVSASSPAVTKQFASTKDKAATPPLQPNPYGEVDGDDAPSATTETASRERCWADYCPCDESDPDYGYMDIPICRDLRMGAPVDAAMFSAGAKARDARKALREWKADNPGVM